MKLSFHGGVRSVTGSCFLLEVESGRVLVDCGMFQGESMVAQENLDQLAFDPGSIDAGVITHAHYDHTGRYPLIVKHGFRGPIYATPPTKALSKIVLEDAQRVMAENAERNGDPILFSQNDVSQMLSQVKARNYHTQFEIIPGVHVMFHDAGHILGSAFVTIDVDAKYTKRGKKMRFVFSGDIGNDDVPILPDTEPISHADVVVCESTYGNRDHEPTHDRERALINMVNTVIKRSGTLLIPAFSIERTQELLYALDGLADQGVLPDVPVYLDSPMAIRATEVYRHYKHYLRFDRSIGTSPDADFFSFPRLRETLTVDASKEINSDSRPKIIIAGSGMMTGGRIMHHLKRYLDDERNGVLIIGYQANGTLGRKIQEGAETVTIYQQEIPVRAKVTSIGSFSAHGDRSKLRSWLQPREGQVEDVYLVHGDEGAKPEFKTYLEESLDAKVHIPQYWQVVEY